VLLCHAGMAKWAFAAASISAVAWLAIPPGLMPGRNQPTGVADDRATKARLAALARARVFHDAAARRTPAVPQPIACRYVDRPVSGTTPKFDCALDNGDRIRVKYGSLEGPGEVAATHLLAALGFAADSVAMAPRLRCYGCPSWPYQTRQVSERLHIEHFFERRIDYTDYTDFEAVSVEWRGRQRELEFGEQEGWGFQELAAIDASLGGATRQEVDALRLMAMFLNHWDNKASNQSLVCPDAACEHPLAMIADAGSTFGPRKVNLDQWRESPVWSAHASCRVTMRHLPYNGGTFVDVTISEQGRQLLADRLLQLGESRTREILSAAGFEPLDEWVAAFNRRVETIARHQPCPS
jgi:hypothetical protein